MLTNAQRNLFFFSNFMKNVLMFVYKMKTVRGLSQKVVDFLYNKKTIRSIAIKFYV